MSTPSKLSPRTTRTTWVAIIASVIVPACAVIPYTDYSPNFVADYFLPVVYVLVALAVIAIAIGVFAFRRGSRIAGALCVLTNIPVLAYYAFLTFWAAIGAPH
jgi:uncharacterized membrane protein YozB (DUF420 family)